MSTTTSNLELTKWTDTDYVNFSEMNENFQKIDESLADGIVEIGTEGNWQYRKWRSGFVELYYNETFSFETTDLTKSGSIYYATGITYAYPSFVTQPKVSSITSCGTALAADGYSVATVNQITNGQISYHLITGTNANSLKGTISINMIGRWK